MRQTGSVSVPLRYYIRDPEPFDDNAAAGLDCRRGCAPRVHAHFALAARRRKGCGALLAAPAFPGKIAAGTPRESTSIDS
jgi:hypothetical protein